ncbi:MAG: aldo/keto reductase, partial [Haloarculaceae archaeon]
TSKVLPSNLDYESVIESCHASLDRLGTDYLDLYLIHWPNPAISLRETLAAFERLQEDGLIRNVGVSNFSTYQLRFARHISDVPIAVNQIEFHPLLYRERLLSFCQEHDVAVTAAAPLARAKVFDHPVIGEVADAYDRSPVQVALRWELQKGVIPIPKSTTPEHIRSNLDVFEWELDDEDVARIDDIDAHERVYMIDPEGDVYGISR